MKIKIIGNAKEIASFVLELQKKLFKTTQTDMPALEKAMKEAVISGYVPEDIE